MRSVGTVAALAVALLAAPAVAAGPASAAPAPLVEQMVVLGGRTAGPEEVRAAAATVRVGRSRCAVAAGTPLAALVRSRVARLGLKDFGSCSRRARDGGGLFVNAIGRLRNRGSDGWVYKAGAKLGTAGAADPSGPFGRGRLRPGARVVWFYCRYDDRAGSCQRTLSVRPRAVDGGLEVAVTAVDDRGRSRPATGARVRAGDATATAGADGVARLSLSPGRHAVHAEGRGLVRSFDEEAEVR